MVTGLGFETTGVVNDAVLKPGQSVTLEASFYPTKAGATTGQISVVSTAVVSPTISLSGTGVESKASSVSLHWQAVSNTLGYFVYRATTSGGPYKKLSSTLVSSPQYVDSVISGHTYYYVVTSVDRANVESSYSNQAAASVPLVP
jgi:fibronectin type 3 domain-containing protein